MGLIVTNANTPSGQRALVTASDMSPVPFGVVAETGPLAVTLPGGLGAVAEGELSSSNGHPITISGYVSPTKRSFDRPLQGADVVNGVLTITNADVTYDFVLANGAWTCALKP